MIRLLESGYVFCEIHIVQLLEQLSLVVELWSACDDSVIYCFIRLGQRESITVSSYVVNETRKTETEKKPTQRSKAERSFTTGRNIKQNQLQTHIHELHFHPFTYHRVNVWVFLHSPNFLPFSLCISERKNRSFVLFANSEQCFSPDPFG